MADDIFDKILSRKVVPEMSKKSRKAYSTYGNYICKCGEEFKNLGTFRKHVLTAHRK